MSTTSGYRSKSHIFPTWRTRRLCSKVYFDYKFLFFEIARNEKGLNLIVSLLNATSNISLSFLFEDLKFLLAKINLYCAACVLYCVIYLPSFSRII